MSLTMWLDRTLDHQRATASKDAIGGNAPSWSTQNASVACAIWPAGTALARTFMRRDLVGTHVIVTASDLGVKSKDRILIGSTYYLVNGAESFNNAYVGSETVYAIDATSITV